MAYRNDYRRSRDYPRDYDTFYDWENPAYPEYYNRNFNRTGYGYNRGTDFDRNSQRSWRDYDFDSEYGYNRGRNFNRFPTRFSRDYDTDADFDYDYEWRTTPTTWTYYEYWWQPGPFVGLGPSDYTRSDERISDDIHDRLTRHGRLDASDIHVNVDNGIVTLEGMVNSRQEKRLAEDLADGVFGVIDVNNHLKISRQGQSGRLQEKQTSAGRIRTGMEVLGKNGEHAGTVKEIRENEFLLDRDMDRDVFVPFNACQKIKDGKLFLNVTANQVDKQGWKKPEVMGMSSS